MDSLLKYSTLIAAIPLILRNINGSIYLLRMSRYFQLEGYDSKRFLMVITRQQRDRRFALLSMTLIIPVFFAITWTWSVSDASTEMLQTFEIQGALVFLVFVAIDFLARPRDKQVKQKFASTQRALRLLITAMGIPILLTAFYLVTVLGSYISDDWLALLFLAVLAAFIAGMLLHLAFFWLPLANLINWPIEEAFRQFYLRRAKGYLKRSGAIVIAITGSYGKTSTKHY